MTERTPNVPELRKYVEWVEEQEALPEIDREWVQEWWLSNPASRTVSLVQGTGITDAQLETLIPHCGTAYCLAGKVAADHDERYVTTSVVDGLHSSDFAAEILGVCVTGLRNRHPIFHPFNTAADIRLIAEAEAGERL